MTDWILPEWDSFRDGRRGRFIQGCATLGGLAIGWSHEMWLAVVAAGLSVLLMLLSVAGQVIANRIEQSEPKHPGPPPEVPIGSPESAAWVRRYVDYTAAVLDRRKWPRG